MANDRIKRDTVEESGHSTPLQGLKEALSDYRIWIFIFMQHMHLASNGFKNFVGYYLNGHRHLLTVKFPSVVEGLGFDRTVTLALTCPPVS